MRTKPNLLLGLLASVLSLLCLLCFTGCASKSIEASSTRLKVSNVTGKSVEITLPKNLDATKLKVVIDPVTGKYELSADKIITDASTVIDSASAAQAQALANLSSMLQQIIPLVVPPRPPAAEAKPAPASPETSLVAGAID